MHYQLVQDNVRVYLDDECGEGWDGDYNPDDPQDEPLLRFSVEIKDNQEWVAVDDASYCTQLPATITPQQANNFLQALMREVHHPLQQGYSIKKTCERMSWAYPQELL